MRVSAQRCIAALEETGGESCSGSGAVTMVVIPVFTLLNIGLSFLPRTLFALLACALSLGARRTALTDIGKVK